MRFPLTTLIHICLASSSILAAPPEVPRPKLQIINGSDEPAEILWLSDDGKRVPNGVVEPGNDSIITTTIGHGFAVLGKKSGKEVNVKCEVPVQGFRFDPAGKDGVPVFYTQRVDVGGFPIVASANVNPYALKESAYIIGQMLSKRPDVLNALVKSGARLSILGYKEFTTDLPEFSHMGKDEKDHYPGVSGKDFWDARARGLGGSETDPFCTCAEENMLGYPGDPYDTENILIHEFAHCIHLRGMSNVDPTFDKRLGETFDKAMAAGLWKDKYAATNRFEYFAEGVQSWFGNNREPDHDHNFVNTRAELLEYDPGLAEFCKEVFGDTELTYTKPATRLTGHMEGYDPSKAPTFTWPKRLEKAKAAIKEEALAADKPKG